MPRISTAELIAKLQEVLQKLENCIASLTVRPDDQTEAALERWLQLAIQICIDLGDRVIAARGLPEPPTQREVFAVLLQAGVLTSDQSTGMVRMVSLRNDLVHDYGGFTAETTPGHVRRALPLLKEVGSALIRALSSS